MLKIWGRNTSSNVQKVLWACEELGVAYERIDAGGPFGGLDKPDYVTRNPNRKIPTIDDDGFILWESNVIVRYLVHRYGKDDLWPRDPIRRARADQWMDWQQTTIGADFIVLIVQLVRTPAEKRDMAAVEAARQKVETAWSIVDHHLATNPYVGGTQFTVGDIPLGIWAWRRYQLPMQRLNYPHLDAWYQRLQQRPGYKKTVMIPLA